MLKKSSISLIQYTPASYLSQIPFNLKIILRLCQTNHGKIVSLEGNSTVRLNSTCAPRDFHQLIRYFAWLRIILLIRAAEMCYDVNVCRGVFQWSKMEFGLIFHTVFFSARASCCLLFSRLHNNNCWWHLNSSLSRPKNTSMNSKLSADDVDENDDDEDENRVFANALSHRQIEYFAGCLFLSAAFSWHSDS